MKLFVLLLISFPLAVVSQTKVSGVVLDKDNHKPLEFVDVFNGEKGTSSNADGRFEFNINDSLVSFNLLGYEKKTLPIKNFNKDTVYLKSKFMELDEVMISDIDEPIKGVFKKILVNYPLEPFAETFFMRCVLKKDNEIVKLQDLNGLLERQTLFSTSKSPMPKKNYVVEIKNMRKAGIEEKGDVYFEMFSFNEFFEAMISLYMSPELYNYELTFSQDREFIKYNFTPKEDSKLKSVGYYLVDQEDNAFHEYYMLNQENDKAFSKRGDIKYRTYYYELDVKFRKDAKDNKHYLNIAKLTAKVEVINKDGVSAYYTAEYYWIAGNQGDYKVRDNTSLNRDIFKISKEYDPMFWENQNQLLLTKDMKEFLKNLDSDKKNEYKTISNLSN
ncbi:carboxypeptidase-like regulatory domain-containing protein [Zunongwangia sp. F363]|uniref:Carboxypeptidase-like regulatory domain-containing protein n=1 Tax=Autumnicola tepida TaxID=3075595 RepID=A0ABU3C6J4_9FLAO|nr:carboxypeptidase-like regulatory domain-containing protein [Zunongwangia sp. F363]MDT0641961.1 carboxypeptidase-like regulatory domain-containing protein [Zunongwangia sp. F363]